MARVVQRRSSPPYLLIVFVFLTLVFAALFTVIYFKYDDVTQANVKLTAKISKLANEQQMSTGDVLNVMTNPQADNTVVGQLRKQIDDLTQIVTGISCATDDAKKQADGVTKELGSTSIRGLVFEVRDMKKQKDAINDKIAGVMAQLKQVQDERDASIKAQKEQKESFDKAADDLTAKNKSLGEDNEKYQADQKTKLDEMKADQQRVVDGLNKNVTDLTKKLSDLQWKNQQLEIRIATMIREFRTKNMPQIEIDKLAKTPKGKVSEVMDQIAYLNKGAKDRVVPGLTFAVYPSTGIPDDGKSKATLIVMNVSDNTSECRIKDAKLTNPVLAGDLVGNVAFDPMRSFTFVVKGDFDLHGAGKANRQGYEEVKDLITRSGGKVVDNLSVKTDFLVMGDEPSLPPKPDEGATPQDLAVYQAQKGAYDDYLACKRQAGDLFIPVLNANRFLSLMGYSPDKAR